MPSARGLHPEFGYFCPSPARRRRFAVALAFIAFGMLAGASGAVLLLGERERHANSTLTAARVDQPSGGAATTSGDSLATTATTREAGQAVAATIAQPTRPTAAGGAACEQDMWAHLDGTCASHRARKARTVRSATDGSALAVIPLGRHTLPSADGEQAPAAASAPDGQPPHGAAPAPATPAAAPAASVTAPSTTEPKVKSTRTAKKVQKTVRKQTSVRSRDSDSLSGRDGLSREEQWLAAPWRSEQARAYAAPDARGSRRGPYERGPWSW